MTAPTTPTPQPQDPAVLSARITALTAQLTALDAQNAANIANNVANYMQQKSSLNRQLKTNQDQLAALTPAPATPATA